MNPPPKFSPTAWFLLGLATAMIDTVQIGVDALGAAFAGIGEIPAQIVNVFIDIVVGLSLFFLFLSKGMLDWKLTVSIVLGFLVDFFTLGIFPAWTADVGYAWLITDGAKTLGAIPIVGGVAQTALAAKLSGGKGVGGGAAGAKPPPLPSGTAGGVKPNTVLPNAGKVPQPPPLPRTNIPSPAPQQMAENSNSLDLRGQNNPVPKKRIERTFQEDYAETKRKYDRIRVMGQPSSTPEA